MTGHQAPPQGSGDPAGARATRAEVARRLGIPPKTFSTWLRAGHFGAVLAGLGPGDITTVTAGDGRWSATVYSDRAIGAMAEVVRERLAVAADDPALLGEDPRLLPDDMWIGPRMWGALAGVRADVVTRAWHAAALRHAEGGGGARDIPAADAMSGTSPRWHLGTYRQWQQAARERPAGHGGRRWSGSSPRQA